MSRLSRVIVGLLAWFLVVSPSALQAQYSDTKIGEYLNYALAATNGSVYVGYNSIGYASPVIYTNAAGWTGLPYSSGFDLAYPYYGYANGVSRDGTVVSGYTWGEVSNGVYVQYAVYWVNGTEQIVPAPPDDPSPTLMTATAVSGDGSTLLVEDSTGSNPSKVETYVYKIATQTFTSVGYFGTATKQTYGVVLSYDGSVAAGYSNIDNGNNLGFRWTATSGLQDLGIPKKGTYYVEPTCMSDDGNVIFGRYTVGGGWVGFRYTSGKFQDTGGISISGCTADGTEAFGIENLYFPAIWSTTVGSGYLDFLLKAHGISATLGDLGVPVTISPDGSLLTSIGPFVYLNDGIWYGTYQIGLPSPLNIPPLVITKVLKLSTAYQTNLTVAAPGVIQYSEFTTGAKAAVVTKPKNAASFYLRTNGSFSYTPKNGYGGKTDSFTYHLVGPGGTSTTAQVKISVAAP